MVAKQVDGLTVNPSKMQLLKDMPESSSSSSCGAEGFPTPSSFIKGDFWTSSIASVLGTAQCIDVFTVSFRPRNWE